MNPLPSLRLAPFILVLCVPARTGAHQWRLTEAIATFPGDGTYQVDFLHDFDSMVAEFPPGQMTEDVYVEVAKHTTPEERKEKLEKVKGSLRRTIRIRFDGTAVQPESLEFPELDAEDPTRTFELPPGPWPGHRARFKGKIPAGAKQFTFWASRGYGPVALRFGEDAQMAPINEPDDPLVLQMLGAGDESTAFPLPAGKIAEQTTVDTNTRSDAMAFKVGVAIGAGLGILVVWYVVRRSRKSR